MSELGTELTLNVHLEPIDGYHMEDYDFECEFFVFTDRRDFGRLGFNLK